MKHQKITFSTHTLHYYPHSNSTRFPPPPAAACSLLALSALLLLRFVSKALTSVPVPISVPVPATLPGLPTAPLPAGPAAGSKPAGGPGESDACGIREPGTGGRLSSEGGRWLPPAELDIAGGGGTFVIGWSLDRLIAPLRLYREEPGSSPPELRLDVRLARRSRRLAARSAAASSSFSRLNVTALPSGWTFIFRLTGGLPVPPLSFRIPGGAALLPRRFCLVRESLRRDGDRDCVLWPAASPAAAAAASSAAVDVPSRYMPLDPCC